MKRGEKDEREQTEVARALDEEGALEREVLAEAASMEAAPGEDRVRDTILALRDEGKRRSRWIPFAAAVAAAATLLVFLLFGRDDPALPDPGPRLLGGPVDEALSPHGVIGADWDGSFAWPAALSEAGAYRLHVYTWEEGKRGDSQLCDEFIEYEATWTPDAATRARIESAGEIEWELVGLDAEERPLSGARRSSWVSFSGD